MCKFKSGIILKTRCVVAENSNDSHRDLLEKLGIEDTETNAMTKFVRVELLPPEDEKDPDGKWWTDPDTWKINVDQDILPDWYEADPEKYNEEFRKAVKDWWNKHVLVGQEIDELSEGFYLLKDCKVGKLSNNVEVVLDDSTVEQMRDSSIVKKMCNDSTVGVMRGKSTVKVMRDNSIVKEMCGSSTVEWMNRDSTVKEMYDDSIVETMWDNSTVEQMHDDSTVKRMCVNSIVQKMLDDSVVQEMCDHSIIQEMRAKAKVQKMLNESIIRTMYNGSVVEELHNCSMITCMYHNTVANHIFDQAMIKNGGKILASSNSSLEIVRMES